MKKIVITGARGLLGWHAHAQLHALNCAARFKGDPIPFKIIALDHLDFDNDTKLNSAVSEADAIVHYAGVNRGSEIEVASENPAIATRLIEACKAQRVTPHIVYANSIHAENETVYGRSKRVASERLEEYFSKFTNLILPHIFGEAARPFYNNVTATFIKQILSGSTTNINPDGRMQLLHAGDAARLAINAIEYKKYGRLSSNCEPLTVPELHAKLKYFHDSYQSNIYPDLSNAFDLALFNSYRFATYPDFWPRNLRINEDKRGILFEAVKGGGGGQTFLSTTKPGVTRGDHFHLCKVERFIVLSGEAIIRIRRVLDNDVLEYRMSGKTPMVIDMPTLHTHSIENIGKEDLLTLFWTNDIFDPKNPDTFADKVLV